MTPRQERIATPAMEIVGRATCALLLLALGVFGGAIGVAIIRADDEWWISAFGISFIAYGAAPCWNRAWHVLEGAWRRETGPPQ